MFGRSRNDYRETPTGAYETVHVDKARAGVAFGPILTGVVVSIGAMFLMLALVGGIVAASGLTAELESGAVEAGLIAGMALVLAQFLAYLWGGYTAGRMARGAGALNGLLVPLVALFVAVVVGAIATGIGSDANLNLPFTVNRLPLEEDLLVDWGIGIGIASLVAMFLGGLVGGALGERWHTRLERRVYEEQVEAVGGPVTATTPAATTTSAEEQSEIDLREREAARTSSETPLAASETKPGTVNLR